MATSQPQKFISGTYKTVQIIYPLKLVERTIKQLYINCCIIETTIFSYKVVENMILI